MKLRFDANQNYQLDAIQSVVDLFEGQLLQSDNLSVTKSKIYRSDSRQTALVEETAAANNRSIDVEQLYRNTHNIQKRNNISQDYWLPEWDEEGWNQEKIFEVKRSFEKHFTVEMETGTGKTYVYLRTIHELYKTYGFKKFIVVVPSVAIKEGVLKNLEITREHFAQLYGNPSLDWYEWNSKKRGQARQFATNDSLQIMVINIDSFTRAENIINQQSDYGTPIQFITATNPIVIVDEPQNMETDTRKAAIESLNPLCTLRYSATHKNEYNLLYKLDPVKAYDLGLVKKVEVDSVVSENAYNTAYINVKKIARKGKSALIAHVEVDKDDAAGLQRKELKLEVEDDLAEITGRQIYEDYVVTRISLEEKCIEFSNGKEFCIGEMREDLRDEVVKFQIERTIENHFEKEKRLQPLGIKVLSLFFLDRVANYRIHSADGNQKGKFAMWFEEAYERIRAKPQFAGVLEHSADQVHNGYFSKDRRGNVSDTSGTARADDDTYGLIMKDKERLLSLNEPLRFIFSHSALREGWDNPNVFQICTLNETHEDIKKRQEIGRGMRLPVNANGERVFDENVNILTVIANESYEDFACHLQAEIQDETGVVFASNRIKDKRKRRTAALKKNYQLDENFQELWSRIDKKTRYHVTFDSQDLVRKTCEMLSDVIIRKAKVVSTKALLNMDEGGIATEVRSTAVRRDDGTQKQLPIPDVLGKIQQHTKLTRATIFSILDRSGMVEKILVNPQQVIDEVTRVINQVMKALMVDGIKYERLDGEVWELQRFKDEELESYLENLVEVQKQEKTLYDHILVDSDVERSFAHECEARDDVRFYFKLPSWFKIDTPLGSYNPDWALVFENDERIYFVAETKGTSDSSRISEIERLKIKSGRKHFEVLDGVEFKAPVENLSQVVD